MLHYTFYSIISFIAVTNNCLSVSCVNGGSCTNSLNAYSCLCVSGYTGALCQTSGYYRYTYYAHQSVLENLCTCYKYKCSYNTIKSMSHAIKRQ